MFCAQFPLLQIVPKLIEISFNHFMQGGWVLKTVGFDFHEARNAVGVSK